MKVFLPISNFTLYCDIMKVILWRQICRNNEHLHVATIELKRMQSPAMHYHDFYECFLILEGDGQQFTPRGDSTLQRNTLYFVRPEHKHAISGQKNLAFLNIAFEKHTFEAAYALANFPSNCWRPQNPINTETLDIYQVDQLVSLASSVANERNRQNASWLLLSIARLLRQKNNNAPTQQTMPDWLAAGLSKAADSEVITEGLPLLNKLMGRSREHIARSFQQHLRMTPTEWLNRERIERACLLLSTTRLSVLEIALDCGFESSSYFNKCFRQLKHTTPRHYRNDLMRIQK